LGTTRKVSLAVWDTVSAVPVIFQKESKSMPLLWRRNAKPEPEAIALSVNDTWYTWFRYVLKE
jgi:hypothetical protein